MKIAITIVKVLMATILGLIAAHSATAFHFRTHKNHRWRSYLNSITTKIQN